MSNHKNISGLKSTEEKACARLSFMFAHLPQPPCNQPQLREQLSRKKWKFRGNTSHRHIRICERVCAVHGSLARRQNTVTSDPCRHNDMDIHVLGVRRREQLGDSSRGSRVLGAYAEDSLTRAYARSGADVCTDLFQWEWGVLCSRNTPRINISAWESGTSKGLETAFVSTDQQKLHWYLNRIKWFDAALIYFLFF